MSTERKKTSASARTLHSGPTLEARVLEGLDWGFLVRTARSTAIASVIIALPLSVYGSLALGARYLFFALWALAFFALSALIFRSMMFNRDRLRGLAFIGAKIAVAGLALYVLVSWPVNIVTERAHGLALVAGLTTPLAVVVLRVLGRAMGSDVKSRSGKQGDPSATQPDASAKRTFHAPPSAG